MWQILSKRVDVTTLSRSSARFSKTSYMYRILDADDGAFGDSGEKNSALELMP